MKSVKILTVAALGLGLLAFTSNAFAGGGNKGSGNKGNGGPGPGKSGMSGNFHKDHHFRAPIIRHYPPVVIVPPPVPVVPAGTVMELPGVFGLRPGDVVLDMHGVIVHPKVLAWTPRAVVVEIPFMKLPEPVCAKLVVIGWDKFAYRPLDVKIVPPLGGPVGGPAVGPAGPAGLP
jgi:hypothetical protein